MAISATGCTGKELGLGAFSLLLCNIEQITHEVGTRSAEAVVNPTHARGPLLNERIDVFDCEQLVTCASKFHLRQFTFCFCKALAVRRFGRRPERSVVCCAPHLEPADGVDEHRRGFPAAVFSLARAPKLFLQRSKLRHGEADNFRHLADRYPVFTVQRPYLFKRKNLAREKNRCGTPAASPTPAPRGRTRGKAYKTRGFLHRNFSHFSHVVDVSR